MDIRDQLLEQAANSVGDMLRRRVAETPNVRAFMYPQGTAVPTNWVTLTWKQTSDIVDQLAAGLLSRGLGYEERVAIYLNGQGGRSAGDGTSPMVEALKPHDLLTFDRQG